MKPTTIYRAGRTALLLTLLAGAAPAGAYVDTTYFLQPRHRDLLDRDLIKIAAPVVIGGDSVAQVSFTARYAQYTSNKMAHSRVVSDLGTDSVPPFEILWDCSRLPDQDLSNLSFGMSYVTVDGKRIKASPWYLPSCVLDRHPAPNPALWTAPRRTAPVMVDGTLDEWAGADSVTFANNDNQITACAAWDDAYLYVAVRVRDANRYPADTAAADSGVATFYKDGLELFLDLDHARPNVRTPRQYQVMTSLDGEVVPVVTRHTDRGPAAEREALQHGDPGDNAPPNYRPRTALTRLPDGYAAEFAFSWDGLQAVPHAGKTMGINLVNSDRETADGVVVTGSWAGISDLQHHNPSEWGTLVLAGPDRTGAVAAAVCLVLALGGGAWWYRRRRRAAAEASAEPPSTQELVIKTVRDYLEQNIGDEGLDLKAAAKYVDLSPDYLRQLFKKVTGENFSAYLNGVRLNKSRELLTGTNRRITEIAFESGFSTYQNFNRVFKDAEGMSPSEYRKKNYAR